MTDGGRRAPRRPLGLAVPFNAGETPTGYLGRLASRNGVEARRFASDMGIRWSSLSVGDTHAVGRLAELVAMPVGPLRDSAPRSEGGRWRWGEESVMISVLRRREVLVCPGCLLSDVGSRGPATVSAWQRASWCLTPVLTCPEHGTELTRIASPVGGRGLPVFADAVAAVAADLPRMAAEAPRRGPSALQDYLLARKAGTRAVPWLDGMTFHAVAVLTRVFGKVALWGPATPDGQLTTVGDLHAADDAGFAVMQAGEDGIFSLLDHHLEAFERPTARGYHYSMFPAVMTALQERRGSSKDFGVMREAVGRYLTTRLPLPAGEYLGVRLERRKLHTVSSAARRAGSEERVIKAMLIGAGVVDTERTGAQAPMVLDAERSDALLLDLASRLTMGQAARRFGVSPPTFYNLVGAGVFRPLLRRAGKRSSAVYRTADVDALLGRLMDGAVPCTRPPAGFVGFGQVCCRLGCDMADVISMLLDRRLGTVHRLDAMVGIKSLLVDPGKVLSCLGRDGPNLRLSDVRLRWNLSHATVTCLRDEGVLRAVADASDPGRPEPLFAVSEIDHFLREHVSLSALARERCIDKRRMRGWLATAGVEPVFDAVRHGVWIYRCADVQAVGHAIAGRRKGRAPPHGPVTPDGESVTSRSGATRSARRRTTRSPGDPVGPPTR